MPFLREEDLNKVADDAEFDRFAFTFESVL